MSIIIDGTNGLTYPNSTVQASAGVVLQVVNATYGTQVSSATASFVDTGLTATITPKFATSKILIIINQNGCWKTSANTGNAHDIKLVGGNTGGQLFAGALSETDSAINNSVTASFSYLDSPATTSATTYKTQFQSRNNQATVYVQYANISISSITLLEIAG